MVVVAAAVAVRGNEGGEGRRCGEMRVGCQGIGLRGATGRPRAAMAAGGALGQSGRTTLAGTGETRRREGALLPAWPSPGAGGSRPPPCPVRSRAVGCQSPSCAVQGGAG